MALARFRVLSLLSKNGTIHRRHQYFRCIFGSLSSPPLLTRLLEEPISRIRTTLDSQLNNSNNNNFSSILKTLEISWDDLITRLRYSSPKKAQLVLEWRLEKLLKENERNHDYYSELIYLCGKIQDVPIAMRVFTSMENHGIQPTSDVFNALVSVFLSSGNVMKALSLFETMGSSESYKPNADTYNAFILAYAMLGNDEKRQAWYSAKTAAGFSVDLQTYQLLILKFIKLNKFCYADKFYKEMISAGIMPNVPILQGMLVWLCEARRLDNVSELLKFILDGGWEINVYMAEKLVWLYTELWRKEEMEELLLDLAKSNQALEVQSRVHAGIIRMNAKVNCLDDVEYSVGRMLKQGMTFTCPDDVEKVICSYFRKEAYDRLDLFLECIKGTYKLTRSTYDLLAAGYRRVGLYEKLDRVVNDMKLA